MLCTHLGLRIMNYELVSQERTLYDTKEVRDRALVGREQRKRLTVLQGLFCGTKQPIRRFQSFSSTLVADAKIGKSTLVHITVQLGVLCQLSWFELAAKRRRSNSC